MFGNGLPASLASLINQTKIMSEGVYGEQAAGRVTHSLLRLSTAMRSQAWEWAEGAGLTPTQGEILVLLMQRKGPMRLGEIARALGWRKGVLRKGTGCVAVLLRHRFNARFCPISRRAQTL